MAEKRIDTDYSGRPVRQFTDTEIAAADTSRLPIYDVVVVLNDGTEAARIDGLLYPLDEEGNPDYNSPINEE